MPAVSTSQLDAFAASLQTLIQIQRDNSLWLQVGLFLLALTASLAAYAAVLAYRASRSALRSERSSKAVMLSETRAWLKAEVSPHSPRIWTDKGCEIAVSLVVENLGKSPAIDVEARLVSVLCSSDSDVASAMNALARALGKSSAGLRIFPGERVTEEHALVLPLDDSAGARTAGPPAGRIVLLGCVNYRTQSGEDGLTGFSYELDFTHLSGVGVGDAPDYSLRQRADVAVAA